MWKKLWKKYGKMVAAAVFLTVAGLCYGAVGNQGDAVQLETSERLAGENAVNLEETSLNETCESIESVQMCFVHICGEVNAPGVYELPEGSRIFEAVEAAGGFTEEASEESLNLAGVISDGMQIVILSEDEAKRQLEAEEYMASGLVNINTASKEQLMTLPGIGESRAEDILRYREESGGFETIEDIMKVSGIKDAAFQKIKDSIVV